MTFVDGLFLGAMIPLALIILQLITAKWIARLVIRDLEAERKAHERMECMLNSDGC